MVARTVKARLILPQANSLCYKDGATSVNLFSDFTINVFLSSECRSHLGEYAANHGLRGLCGFFVCLWFTFSDWSGWHLYRIMVKMNPSNFIVFIAKCI